MAVDMSRLTEVLTRYRELGIAEQLDYEKLSLMKPTALLVNTARGPVCDIPAVGRALVESRIAGAAFDVFEQEPPLPVDHLLLSTGRCLVTPHVAFATEESFAARANIVFGHIDEYLKS